MKTTTPAQTLADAVRALLKTWVSNVPQIATLEKALKAFDDAATEQGPEPACDGRIIASTLCDSLEAMWREDLESPMRARLQRNVEHLVEEYQATRAQPPQPEPALSDAKHLGGDPAEPLPDHDIEKEEAKPGDWMRAAMNEVKDHLHLRGYYIGELENVECRAIIAKHHAHCANAAGDAREAINALRAAITKPLLPDPEEGDAREVSAGARKISEERARQITKEEWTAYHDDHHEKKELSHAAAAYLSAYWFPGMTGTPGQWPKDWGDVFFKPSPDPVRNLVKAGALIAAEIDRLERAKASQTPSDQ